MTEAEAPETEQPKGNVSRRRMLGFGAAGVGVAAAGFAGGYATRAIAEPTDNASASGIVPFYGVHQAGISTPAQDRLAFGSLNLVPGVTAAQVKAMLAQWTVAAERMTRGELVGESANPTAPPLDTGEAQGSPPANLTITIGYGPSFFDSRLGLQNKKPSSLADLPVLPNENLDPNYTGGDIAIQACSDNPLVAFHAVRNLARLGMGVVAHNWMELGFGRTSSTSTTQETPRNLMGFKDGTRNVKTQETTDMNDYVWVGNEADQQWMVGGSFLVARRIRIFIENWDRDYLQDQENVIGRTKGEGAPLSGGSEFTEPDFKVVDTSTNEPLIPTTAHIRMASPESNGGIKMLRRGYSFTDGIDPVRGTLLGGLFFIAFVKHPSQFISVQRNLGGNGDGLNEYIKHTGSAVFACPPGLSQGQVWGADLFG
jgi:deferrochelatase/peroxidase EfeB